MRACRLPSRDGTACWYADIVGGVADCVYRVPASPMALAETRRYLQLPLKLTAVASEEFDDLLRKTYEGGGESMQIGSRGYDRSGASGAGAAGAGGPAGER